MKKVCFFLLLPRFADRDDCWRQGYQVHQVNSYHGVLCQLVVVDKEIEKEMERIFLRAFPAMSVKERYNLNTCPYGPCSILDNLMSHSSWQFPQDRRFEFLEK